MYCLFNLTEYIHVIHTLASHLRNQHWNPGQSGVDVSKPAGYAVCDGNVSSYPAGAAAGYCFLLVSSSYPAGSTGRVLYSSHFFFFLLLLLATLLRLIASTCLDRFLPIFVTKPLTHGIYVIWPEWGQRSCRGHRGQKVNFLKNVSTPLNYVALTRGLYICYSLKPFYKSYGYRKSPGVIWGHRGQKVIFTKNASTPLDYVALTRDLYIWYSLATSTKVTGIENHLGSFEVTGVKRSFSQKNAIIRPCYTAWR